MTSKITLQDLDKDILQQRMTMVSLESFLTSLDMVDRIVNTEGLTLEMSNFLLASVNSDHLDIICNGGGLEAIGNLSLASFASRTLRATYEFFRKLMLSLFTWLGIIDETDEKRFIEITRYNLNIVLNSADIIIDQLGEAAIGSTHAAVIVKEAEDFYSLIATTEDRNLRDITFGRLRVLVVKLYSLAIQHGVTKVEGILHKVLEKPSGNPRTLIGSFSTKAEILEVTEVIRVITLDHNRRLEELSRICIQLNKSTSLMSSKGDRDVEDACKKYAKYINSVDSDEKSLACFTISPMTIGAGKRNFNAIYYKVIKDEKKVNIKPLEVTANQLVEIFKLVANASFHSNHILKNSEERLELLKTITLNFDDEKVKAVLNSFIDNKLSDSYAYVFVENMHKIVQNEALLLKSLIGFNNNMTTDISMLPVVVQ